MVGTLANIVIAQLVAFAIIVVVLKRMLMNDTLNAVKRLREVEADLARKEDAARRKMEENEKEFARRTAEMREELERAREAAERESEKKREAILAEAKRESDRIMKEAKLNEERLRREIQADMHVKALEYANGILGLVFSEQITGSLNEQFIGELIEALEGLDASSISIDASQMDFISSHPLDPAQRHQIEELLLAKFGTKISVQEKVDPALLAGLVIKLGDLEIDGSLRSRIREAADEVKKKTF